MPTQQGEYEGEYEAIYECYNERDEILLEDKVDNSFSHCPIIDLGNIGLGFKALQRTSTL